MACGPAGIGVYPRVCGGAVSGEQWAHSPSGLSPRVRGALEPEMERGVPWGLSPRVRGSRRAAGRPGRRPGSIPACAGEPKGWCASGASAGVYPRVCGGALEVVLQAFLVRGLSPRVRGSPRLGSAAHR